jgi:glycine/D-amino acid oxidase-like deaminating enzyme
MVIPNLNTFAPALKGHDFMLPQLEKGGRVVVVGAGAFGSSASLFLLKKGFQVMLFDAWGVGNAYASSGDETRVIRSTYGANGFYFDLNVRALTLWRELEKETGQHLFNNTGVIWLCYDEHTPLVDESISFATKHKMEYEYLTKQELTLRHPAIESSDLHHAYFDPYGGYLNARRSMISMRNLFVSLGGHYEESFVLPGDILGDRLQDIQAQSGEKIKADLFIFACGSWLGSIFPDVLGEIITCTRQEVYYFGIPRQHSESIGNLPVWVDVDGRDFYYGIPQNNGRGFKIGVDRRGKRFDPSLGDRLPDPVVLEHARNFVSHRFPALRNAPLIENRVCPYENSPDGNFIFDRHPDAENVLFLGGGSGHGFKHGPALGEVVADVLTGKRNPPGIFSLNRFGG